MLGTSCGKSTPTADPCASPANGLYAESDSFACRWERDLPSDHPCRFIPIIPAEAILGRRLAIPGYTVNDRICFNVSSENREDRSDFNYSFVAGSDGQSKFQLATRTLTERIPNVGLAAAWDPKNRTLHVSTNTGYFWVQVPRITNPRAAALKLVALALKRLG